MRPNGSSQQPSTVEAALALFDGEFAAMAKAVSERKFALWVGSGVSFGCAPNLGELLKLALEHLRSKIDATDTGCAFRVALMEILGRSTLPTDQIGALDLSSPISDWPQLQTIIGDLWNQYADVLDTRIEGEAADYMVWSAVDVRNAYGSLRSPGVSHLCIAILIMEGVLAQIASANWDPLIEHSLDRLAGGAPLLQVAVEPRQLRGAAKARLLKFHGCARYAQTEPDVFRKYLVATQPQITSWPHEHLFAPMRHELMGIAANTHTLMVGLSLQDANLQDLFANARSIHPWPWPCSPDAQGHVFCEERLGDRQRNMLRVVYGQTYQAHRREIEASAVFPVFAAPTLLAMVLYVGAKKLESLANLAGSEQRYGQKLGNGLAYLRSLLAQHVSDRVDSVNDLIRIWSNAIQIFRSGQIDSELQDQYIPLTTSPEVEFSADPNVLSSGLGQIAVCLSLLGLGAQAGTWNISLVDTDGAPALSVCGTWPRARRAKLYLVSSAAAAIRVTQAGLLSDASTVVVHADDAWENMVASRTRGRSPTAPLGRTGRVSPRHVSMMDLVRSSTSLQDLLQRFEQKAAI